MRGRKKKQGKNKGNVRSVIMQKGQGEGKK